MYESTIDAFLIARIFLIIIPAYMANAFAFLLGDGKPIDLGRNFIDGKRIFGDGKTVRGFFSGVIFGTLGGGIFALVTSALNLLDFSYYLFILTFIIATGSVLGDMTGAFIKRRLGLVRGAPLPGLDQLNFILLAVALAYIFTLVVPVIKITLLIFIIILIATPLSHIISCLIAYKKGKKKEPW